MFKANRDADVNGTSFHSNEVRASPEQLREAFGEPAFDDNFGHDKVNMEWSFEDDEGNVFTLYDWKHYRPLYMECGVNWHIGSKTPELEEKFQNFVENALKA